MLDFDLPSSLLLDRASSMRILSTPMASLPKLKKEKKYYSRSVTSRRSQVMVTQYQVVNSPTSSIAYVSSLSITRILQVSANSSICVSSMSMTF